MNLSMLRERRWEVCYSCGWGCSDVVAQDGDFEPCQDPTSAAGDPAPRGCAWCCTHSRTHAPRGAMQGGTAPYGAAKATPSLLLHPAPYPGDQKMQSPSLMHSHPRQKPGTFRPNALHLRGAAPGGDAAGRHAAALGAAEGAGLWGRQTSTSGRAQHTWRAAPAPLGLQPAPAEPWGLHNAQHHAPRGSAPCLLPPAPCCGPMAGAGTGLSWEGGCWVGGCWVGGCRAVSPMEPQEFGGFAGGHPGDWRRGSGPRGACKGDGLQLVLGSFWVRRGKWQLPTPGLTADVEEGLGLPPPRWCVLLGLEALRGSAVVLRCAGMSRSTALLQDHQHSTVHPRPCSSGRPSTSSTGWPRTPSGLGSRQPQGFQAALEALILPHSPWTPCHVVQPCLDVREQRGDPKHPAVIAPPAMPRAGQFLTPSPR